MNSFKDLDRSKVLAVAGLAGVIMISGCCTKSYKTASYKQTSYASAAPAESYSAATTEQAQAQTPSPTGRTEGGTNMVVPLYQENLAVGKREVDSGTVRLKKVVKTETVVQPIELKREEVVIERDSGPAKGGEQVLSQPFQEQETVIHLKREEPVIEKQTVQSGHVVVQTRASEEQRNIQAQVRREDVAVDKSGSAAGAAETTTGTGAGAGANVITSPDQLTTASGASYNGRPVKFANCKVDRVVGDKLIILKADSGQQIFVVSSGDNSKLHEGDTVMITGTVKAGNASDAGLSGEAAQELSGKPIYIQAQSVQPVGTSGQSQDQSPNSSSPNEDQK